METIQFKTNIKCGGCVAKVTPFLDKTFGKDGWKVDTESAEKILTVTGEEGINADEIVKQVAAAGFRANKI